MTDAVKAPAVKTVADIDARKAFDSIEAALAHIAVISAYEGFDDLQHAIVGAVQDAEGNTTLDPEVYTNDMRVTVAVINEKIKGGSLKPIGLTVYPTPTLDAVLVSDEGKAWLAKLVEKESNLVAMRPLRKEGADFAEAVAAMPTSVATFITPSRDGATGILASFEAVWRDVKKLMGAKNRPWATANFSKRELRRAFESASYAAGTYPRVEKDGGDSSIFVFALNLAKMIAAKQDLDTAFFDKCLATRDQHTINIDDGDEDEGGLDLEAMLNEATSEEAAGE